MLIGNSFPLSSNIPYDRKLADSQQNRLNDLPTTHVDLLALENLSPNPTVFQIRDLYKRVSVLYERLSSCQDKQVQQKTHELIERMENAIDHSDTTTRVFAYVAAKFHT